MSFKSLGIQSHVEVEKASSNAPENCWRAVIYLKGLICFINQGFKINRRYFAISKAHKDIKPSWKQENYFKKGLWR